MKATLHSELVADVVRKHGATARGFRSAMLGYLEPWGEWNEIPVPRCVPDAWKIEVTAGDELDVVTLWEVEVTHPLPDYKLREYVWLWGDMDATDIYATLDVWRVDRYGVERQVDLVQEYMKALKRS